MSEFKDRVSKNVQDIYDSISNESEREAVLKSVQSLITDFTTHLVQLSEYQNELQEQIIDLQESVVDIQNRMDDEYDDDLYDVCPYCGEEIFVIPDENTHEFECPKCHKTIVVDEN